MKEYTEEDEYTLVQLPWEEFDFITRFDPERERVASRTQLVEVVRHIQAVLMDGHVT